MRCILGGIKKKRFWNRGKIWCWLALTVNLTQSEIIQEETLGKGGLQTGMGPQEHSLDIQKHDINNRKQVSSEYEVNVQHGKWMLKVPLNT